MHSKQPIQKLSLSNTSEKCHASKRGCCVEFKLPISQSTVLFSSMYDDAGCRVARGAEQEAAGCIVYGYNYLTIYNTDFAVRIYI